MELEWDNPDRPEATNLLTLYQLSTGKTKVGLQDLAWNMYAQAASVSASQYHTHSLDGVE